MRVVKIHLARIWMGPGIRGGTSLAPLSRYIALIRLGPTSDETVWFSSIFKNINFPLILTIYIKLERHLE